MDKETAKAINNISKKSNEVERRLNEYFGKKCDENAENIEMVDTTMESMMLDTLPEIEESSIENSDNIDLIITELLPKIVEMIEEMMMSSDEYEEI